MGHQMGPGRPGQPPGAHQVDPPGPLDLPLFAVIEEKADPGEDAGTVNETVEAAEMADGRRHPWLSTGRIVRLIGMEHHAPIAGKPQVFQ